MAQRNLVLSAAKPKDSKFAAKELVFTTYRLLFFLASEIYGICYFQTK